MSSIGIAHNGPMTSFTLMGCHCGDEWFLCRDDMGRIANGILTFDDCRPEIQLEEDEKAGVIDQAKKLVDQIERGSMLAELGEDYFGHFEKTAGNYVNITVDDLGHKFIWEGKPFALLGAKRRARTFPLIARSLMNGKRYGFTVSAIEKALGQNQNVETITTTDS